MSGLDTYRRLWSTLFVVRCSLIGWNQLVKFGFVLSLLTTLNVQHSTVFGQTFMIDTVSSSNHASAFFQINSKSGGLLIPRMTQAQRTSIGSPATGLWVYQTDGTAGLYVYDGASWDFMQSESSGWAKGGNAGTADGTNYVGTSDAVEFEIQTDATSAIRIKTNGNVGLRTTDPDDLFSVGPNSEFQVNSSGKVDSIDGGLVSPYMRILYIDSAGKGDYTSIENALAAISPTVDEPYMLLVSQGDYRSTWASPTTLESYVTIVGSGEGTLVGPFSGTGLVDVEVKNCYFYADHGGDDATTTLSGDVLFQNCKVYLAMGVTAPLNTYRTEGGVVFDRCYAPDEFDLQGTATVTACVLESSVTIGQSTYAIAPTFSACHISGTISGDNSEPIFRDCAITGTYNKPAKAAVSYLYHCYIATMKGATSSSGIEVYNSYVNSLTPNSTDVGYYKFYNTTINSFTGVAYTGAGDYTIQLANSEIYSVGGTSTMVSTITEEGSVCVEAPDPSVTPGYVQAASAQTADLTQWQNSGGTVETMVDASGQFGVDDTDPAYAVEVGGDVNFTGALRIDGGTGSANEIIGADGNGGVQWYDVAEMIPEDAWSKDGNPSLTAGTNFIGTTDAQDVVFKTNNTERMRIKTDGKVGIGTTTPAEILHVNGTVSSPGAGTNSERFGAASAAAGDSAVAFGYNTAATGRQSVVVSNQGSATDSNAVVIGRLTTSTGKRSVSMGYQAADNGGDNCVSLGNSSDAFDYGIALGSTSGSTTKSSFLAIGLQATTSVDDAIVMGRAATVATANYFVAGSGTVDHSNIHFGKGITHATPTAYTIEGTAGSGTDIAGADLQLAGGQGTGTGTGGEIQFYTAASGASGTSLNANSERMVIEGEGKIGINETSPNSGLEVEGGMILPIATKTAAYTLDGDDHTIIADASGGTFTVTLPTAVGITGRMYIVKKIDGSNNVTIATTSSQTIDGAAPSALTVQYEILRVVSDGSNWWKLN